VHGLLVEAKGVEMNLEFSEASVLQMALQHQQKSLLRRRKRIRQPLQMVSKQQQM